MDAAKASNIIYNRPSDLSKMQTGDQNWTPRGQAEPEDNYFSPHGVIKTEIINKILKLGVIKDLYF